MIEVGEYIRAIDGEIGKAIKINKRKELFTQIYLDIISEDIDGYFVYEEDIIAHSKNIIDLIEVGDIVKLINGLNKTEFIIIQYLSELDIIKSHKIISILTHEQYEQNCYKVGDIE